jgi:diguanylate cyclase (GGDEF)-like protein
VILPGADAFEASQAAERLRSAVAGAYLRRPERIGVTLSVGAASTADPAAATADDLYAAADQALYAAKRNGRDRVEVAGPLTNRGTTI